MGEYIMIGKTLQGGSDMADPKKMPREMTGAELKSMLKSSINFKSLGAVSYTHLDVYKRQRPFVNTVDCRTRLACLFLCRF